MNARCHLVPCDDLKPHAERGVDCMCAPSIQQEGELVVHNAFDGRELLGQWDHWLLLEIAVVACGGSKTYEC